MTHLLTFIGFGEAAYSIAKGLKREGLTGIVAFDAMQDKEPMATLIHTRAEETGVKLAESLNDACKDAKFILSVTSASVCVNVAKSVLPFLEKGQIYADMNSAGPTSMTEIDELPWANGVKFCDVAMMGSVPQGEHRTKMFLSGNGARAFYDAMKPFNMNMTVLDTKAGGASAIKMFKSVFSKGIPQLLLECLVPAAKYGVLEYALEGIKNPFADGVETSTKTLLYRTMVHAKRRAAEMNEVSETIEKMGLDASMSRAAQHKLETISAKTEASGITVEEDFDLRKLIEQFTKVM